MFVLHLEDDGNFISRAGRGALFLYFATITTACCNGTLLSYEYALDRSRIGQADAAHETETLVCGGMCINARTWSFGLMGTGPGFGDTPLITAIKKDQVEAVDAFWNAERRWK